jgi:MFS family permease
MLILIIGALVLLSVPLTGGRLSALGNLRIRAMALLVGALVVKFTVILLVPEESWAFHGTLHILSYVLGGLFLVANRRLPGFGMITLGGLMNFLAIAANGGVMPSTGPAFAQAGLNITAGRFSNSAPLADPNLGFLGDIFATPASWPFSNVFSLGDICIVLGLAVALHRLCGSRLIPSGDGQFRSLVANRNFRRVWLAQGISNLGDWVYSLAVLATLALRGEGAHALAVLLIVQMAPAAITGALGGPLVDRLNRKRLMILSDVVRFLAVGSLLFAGSPSLPHIYVVGALLGVSAGLFQPSLQASLPNLVPKGSVVAANAMVAATYNFAVMAGPVVGGLLVARLGPRPAFAVNTVSFVISGLLIIKSKIRQERNVNPVRPLTSLVEGFRYSLATPLVRGALIVIGFVMVSSTLRTPLEPLFVVQELRLPTEALGLIGGAWGLGMLLGSFAAPAAARRWRREHLLFASIAVVGLTVLQASRSTSLSSILGLWVISGAANGMGSVAYDSLLQERTPDAFRGRVMAASEAVFHGAFLLGVSLSGWFGSRVGIRPTYALSGLLLLATAVVCRAVLGSIRGRHRARTVVRSEPTAGVAAGPPLRHPVRLLRPT